MTCSVCEVPQHDARPSYLQALVALNNEVMYSCDLRFSSKRLPAILDQVSGVQPSGANGRHIFRAGESGASVSDFECLAISLASALLLITEPGINIAFRSRRFTSTGL